MTNAEKYLKEGVSVEEFCEAIDNFIKGNGYSARVSREFLNATYKPITPTLTEDERVILRNIPKYYETIGKCKNGVLYVTTDRKIYLDKAFGGFFNHLFQFIQERRRIRNS